MVSAHKYSCTKKTSKARCKTQKIKMKIVLGLLFDKNLETWQVSFIRD